MALFCWLTVGLKPSTPPPHTSSIAFLPHLFAIVLSAPALSSSAPPPAGPWMLPRAALCSLPRLRSSPTRRSQLGSAPPPATSQGSRDGPFAALCSAISQTCAQRQRGRAVSSGEVCSDPSLVRGLAARERAGSMRCGARTRTARFRVDVDTDEDVWADDLNVTDGAPNTRARRRASTPMTMYRRTSKSPFIAAYGALRSPPAGGGTTHQRESHARAPRAPSKNGGVAPRAWRAPCRPARRLGGRRNRSGSTSGAPPLRLRPAAARVRLAHAAAVVRLPPEARRLGPHHLLGLALVLQRDLRCERVDYGARTDAALQRAIFVEARRVAAFGCQKLSPQSEDPPGCSRRSS